MSARRLWILLLAALIVAGAAVWLSSPRKEAPGTAEGAKVLPELQGELNSITEARLIAAGDKVAVTLKRDGETWRLGERDGYPADAAKLRKLLIDLSQLTVVETKTSNPASYGKLGVEDLKAPSATGTRIDLLGLKKPAALIVGKSAAGSAVYVRVAGRPESLLAKPSITVEREPRNWMERSIVDFPLERVQQVRVELPKAQPYTASRAKHEQADFEVAGVPKGRTLSSPSAANTVAGALAGLTLDDVRKDQATDDWGAQAPKTEYRLFDGTTVTVTGRTEGDKHLVRIAVAFDEAQHERFKQTPTKPAAGTAANPTGATGAANSTNASASASAQPSAEDVRKAAVTAQSRVEGWLFEIPAYKYETLFQPMNDLLSTP